MSRRDGKAAFRKLIAENARRHRVREVFADFVEMAALAISNSVDALNRTVREERYRAIAGKYEPDEIERFGQMLGIVVLELEAGMHDCLGELLMELGIGDARKGQFFTPYCVSSLMASMTLADAAERIARRGCITLNEPTCGSGSMVIAAAQALQGQGINYQQSMHALCIDIDATACHMAYLQLSLLHIPAVIVHGNALWPDKTWGEWLTPAHVLGDWGRRLAQLDTLDAMRALLQAPQPGPADGADTVPAVTLAQVQSKRQAQALADQMALF